MQCHAIALDTTGTTYARQQPRCIEHEGQKQRKTKQKNSTHVGCAFSITSSRHHTITINAFLAKDTVDTIQAVVCLLLRLSRGTFLSSLRAHLTSGSACFVFPLFGLELLLVIVSGVFVSLIFFFPFFSPFFLLLHFFPPAFSLSFFLSLSMYLGCWRAYVVPVVSRVKRWHGMASFPFFTAFGCNISCRGFGTTELVPLF